MAKDSQRLKAKSLILMGDFYFDILILSIN
jgi:hypothetical protein